MRPLHDRIRAASALIEAVISEAVVTRADGCAASLDALTPAVAGFMTTVF